MKLAKASIPYRAVKSGSSVIFLLLFTSSSRLSSLDLFGFLAAGFALLLVVALALLWYYLVWRNYDYFIEDGSIRINQGVIRRKEREVPSRRIQNIDVKKNIVHRALGLARVDLETAGGGTTEASLRYVKESQVDEIRQKLRESDQEPENENERDFLYRITGKQLGLLGTVSLNWRTISLMLGYFGIAATTAGAVLESTEINPVLVVSVLLVSVAVFGIAVNLFTVYTRYYGFRLWEEEDVLRYERGLFNRVEGSIPLDKVQTISIEENPLKRLLGYATLKIETAGYAGEKAADQGSEAAIPLAPRAEVERFLKEFEQIEVPEMNQVSRKARRRYIGRYTIILGVVTLASLGIAHLFELNYLWALAPLLLAPLIPVAAHLKWKNRGYSAGELFVTRNGFWNRRTVFTPYYRVQNLVETQTILQRRWRLSSLTVDVAGSGFFGSNPVAVDLDTQNLRTVRNEVYARFLDSLGE
jgi:putative membrane protein